VATLSAPSFAAQNHELTETLFELLREGSGNHVALIAIVKVQRKRRKGGPVCVGEIVEAIDTAVEMTALPMKTKTPTQLARDPHVDVAGVGQQHPQLEAERIGLHDDIGKLDLGDATELIQGTQASSLNESSKASRSASKWSNSK